MRWPQNRLELEQELITSGLPARCAVFMVGAIIRYCLKDDTTPYYEAFDQGDGELPVAIEMDLRSLVNASEQQMAQVYREANLRVLVHVGEKYGLPVERLKALLAGLAAA